MFAEDWPPTKGGVYAATRKDMLRVAAKPHLRVRWKASEMSDPSLSNIPSQSRTSEPAVLMVQQNIDFWANLSPQVRGIADQHPIIVPYDADYEELKMRVLSNLM